MKKNTRARAAVLVSAGFVLASTLPGQAAAQSGQVLENVANPGYVLDNDAGGGADSAVLTYRRNGGPNQLWDVSPEKGNPVQLRQRIGGRELCAATVFNGIADVSMQDCESSGGVSHWQEIQVGDNRWVYRSSAQHKCLAATRLDAPAGLVDCAFGDQEQQWVKRAG
ncbi:MULTISPECIES: ricin-type beta-trefoil lectin domain protein [Streptomyces]|uniref:Ricin-type beta-trefoil lectin domain protein n=1 Tax=Streptomyces ramulosus TaxID=47762 RepID=A0ABW1FNN0_9ACTN